LADNSSVAAEQLPRTLVAPDQRLSPPRMVHKKPFVTGFDLMRLFFIALAFSALATFSYGQERVGNSGDSGWQPTRSSRFEASSAQDYLVRRARAESEHRISMLRYYDSIGFNYGSPLINGGTYFNVQAPNRHRHYFWIHSAYTPTSYGL
jgi:hypothetical protein